MQATSVAVLARLAEGLEQVGADPLAGHLHETERGDLGDLVLGAVPAETLHQPAQHQIAVGLQHHVDEVDDDDAADVAQPELADDLLGRLEVVLGHRLLEVAAGPGELAGVDVDDGHRLSAVDHQRAAAGQPDLALEGLRDLLVDAVGREDVAVPSPSLQPVSKRGRDVGHVRLDGVPRLVARDDELGEVLVEQIPDHLDGQVRLAVEQLRGRARGLLRDVLPLRAEPRDVVGELLLRRTFRGGADDDARNPRGRPP